MREISLGFIGTSRESIDRAKALALHMGQHLECALSGLEDARIPGREMVEEQGVEVLISRRGTAHMLREHCAVPVVSIPDTSMNILKTLWDASKISKRILITFFYKSLTDLTLFEDILGVKLIPLTYRDRESLENALMKAKSRGYDIVVGGGVTNRLARRHGMRSMNFQIPDETILSALEDARNIAMSRREEAARYEQYRTIMDAVSDGILATDNTGRITSINRAARSMLRLPESQHAEGSITDLLPDTDLLDTVKTGRPSINKLQQIGSSSYVVNSVPVLSGDEVVGGVSTFQEASHISKAESAVRRAQTKGLRAKYRLEDYYHTSKIIRDMIKKARTYAASESSVLITGETGTGKEIIAHGIHLASKREKGPFVSINCSALPDQLLESELFGYEEGSFTGSRRGGKAGLFELAHEGTIFLDEIGSTPMNVQTRLLRVLQEKEVMRLGGDTVIPINARVVAATNQNLRDEVCAGRMREDLFFRLDILPITLPPLRKRPEDIGPLFKRLALRVKSQYGRKGLNVPARYLKRLADLPWPGNTRQLEHFAERLVVLCGDKFNPEVFEDLIAEMVCSLPAPPPAPISGEPPSGGGWPPAKVEYPRATIEPESLTRERVINTLVAMGNSKNKAAEALGISRTTLWRRMQKWGIAGA